MAVAARIYLTQRRSNPVAGCLIGVFAGIIAGLFVSMLFWVNAMPIYEYQCQECSHQMEALQKISDAPLTDCPACSKPTLGKLISAPGFRLAGSGWYETDFKTGAKKNLAGDNAGSAGNKSASN